MTMSIIRSLAEIIKESDELEQAADMEVGERNIRRGRFIVESRQHFDTAAKCIDFWMNKYHRSQNTIYHYANMVGGFATSTIIVDDKPAEVVTPPAWNKPWHERKTAIISNTTNCKPTKSLERIEFFNSLMDIINLGFAQAARRAHPDGGGSVEAMHKLTTAKQALIALARNYQ
jgi:hypothetical protein